MELRVLGPLEVRAGDGAPVDLAGPKLRALLVALLLEAGRPVSADRLAAALWGEDAPARAVKNLQVHVSRLRRALRDPSVLVTTPGGYHLHLRPGELDVERFEALAERGRRALADGHAQDAARLLREALVLWRGPPLADVEDTAAVRGEIERLEEQHAAVLEARVDADLELGRHAELVGELRELVAARPLREGLHRRLMLALYRSGRQAEALQVFRQARELLVEQLGLEPGPELRGLERAVLAQDPALELAPPAPAPPPPRARRRPSPLHAPVPPTPLVGREADLARLAARARDPARRLITVAGPGGVGKTRLALELAAVGAEDHADGVRFVGLGPLADHDAVAPTLARALDAVVRPGDRLEDALADHVRHRELLLVLDNFEHVLGAAPLVAALLAAAPGLTVVVTSREPLRLRGEHVLRLEPLALPPPGTDDAAAVRTPAVLLLAAAARARDDRFVLGPDDARAAAEACRRLDGLPLAIELAAGRLSLLSVPELAERLREGLDAVGTGPRDAPDRQRTLRATLEWSAGLLDPGERDALTALATFASGASIEAARAVTGAAFEQLEALVDKNLLVLRRRDGATGRLTMLETVRAFARDELARRPDAERLRGRHLAWFLEVAERAAPEMRRAQPQALVERLGAEVDEFRAALAWSLGRRLAEPSLRLAVATSHLWWPLGLPREPARWLEPALELLDHGIPRALRAAVLRAAARALADPPTAARAQAAAREAVELARAAGDRREEAEALVALAHVLLQAHRVEETHRVAGEAVRLARELGDEDVLVEALELGATSAPALDEALALADEAVAIRRRAGHRQAIALLQSNLAYAALYLDRPDVAGRLADEALQVAEGLSTEADGAYARGNAGLAALLRGHVADAREHFTRELASAHELGDPGLLFEATEGLAALACAGGRDRLAATLHGAAVAGSADRHDPVIARRLEARFFAPARERLGDQAWQAALAAGRGLPRERVLHLGLATDDET